MLLRSSIPEMDSLNCNKMRNELNQVWKSDFTHNILLNQVDNIYTLFMLINIMLRIHVAEQYESWISLKNKPINRFKIATITQVRVYC